MTALRARHVELVARPLVPVHGAPHGHQWLNDDSRLGLIDFDRFARGEPELDVATFLAELDGDSALSLPVNALEEGLREGYRDGGVELDVARLDLYRTHKRLAKVTRTAWSLRPDGDSRAERHLRRVSAVLGL
jgi:thiamine kinase-like enzyme